MQKPSVLVVATGNPGKASEIRALLEGFPIEVKASSSVRPMDARSIPIFREKWGAAAQPGLIVYGGNDVRKLTDDCAAVPFDLA